MTICIQGTTFNVTLDKLGLKPHGCDPDTITVQDVSSFPKRLIDHVNAMAFNAYLETYTGEPFEEVCSHHSGEYIYELLVGYNRFGNYNASFYCSTSDEHSTGFSDYYDCLLSEEEEKILKELNGDSV